MKAKSTVKFLWTVFNRQQLHFSARQRSQTSALLKQYGIMLTEREQQAPNIQRRAAACPSGSLDNYS